MVEADEKFAANHNTPELEDSGTQTFGNKITMVDADTMFAQNQKQTKAPRCWSTSVRKQDHYRGGRQEVCNKSQQTRPPRCWNISVRKQHHKGGSWQEVCNKSWHQTKASRSWNINIRKQDPFGGSGGDYHKPDLQDTAAQAFGSRITMVEADKILATNHSKPDQTRAPRSWSIDVRKQDLHGGA